MYNRITKGGNQKSEKEQLFKLNFNLKITETLEFTIKKCTPCPRKHSYRMPTLLHTTGISLNIND